MSNPAAHKEYSADAWPSWATEPIRLRAADPAWPEMAGRARAELSMQLASFPVSEIEHIGSTAVPGLDAKPIIDLLATIPSFDGIDDVDGIAMTFAPTAGIMFHPNWISDPKGGSL